MAGAGRQHDDIARFDSEHLTLGAAELHGRAAARYAQHFMRRRMEMPEGVDAVAPAIAPAMPAEGALERHRRIALAREIQCSAIDEQRQAGIVGRFAVVFEMEGLYVGHGQILRHLSCESKGTSSLILSFQ